MKVTIKYIGTTFDSVRNGSPVCSVFEPNSSYIDTPAYKYGVMDKDGEKELYGKSVYATNVGTYGTLEDFLRGIVPIATAPIRLAKFEQAIETAVAAEKAGEENEGISFEIGDDYKESIYWEQISKGMIGQGFEVTVDTTPVAGIAEISEAVGQVSTVANSIKSDTEEILRQIAI